MSKVVIDVDSAYAPCSYLICAVDTQGEWNTHDDCRTVLVQTDWDYPGLASNLGWSTRNVQSDPKPRHWQTGEEFVCEHDSTDGTVKCESCGVTVSEFIESAREFLDEHLGEEFEDPGYFE